MTDVATPIRYHHYGAKNSLLTSRDKPALTKYNNWFFTAGIGKMLWKQSPVTATI